MNVLVTGGAGYIGSHAVRALVMAGHRPVVLDNLYRGHAEAIDALQKATGQTIPLENLDLRQTDAIVNALTHHKIDCVMHFAALAYVGESVTQPLSYYDNNTTGSISLLQAMDRAGVRRLVFSSTCATYGQPDTVPIVETTHQSPINPYGWSKLFVERILQDYAAATKDFAYAALRYFNVAGSADDGSIGEDHTPETHIIPVLLNVALGKQEKGTVFGDDYPTPDGSCIRDYIHVEDLVEAHIAVMDALQPRDERYYNLGIGQGKSVFEIVAAARDVTGHAIPMDIGPRRAGDPPMLFANADKIRRELQWSAKRTDVRTMIEHAWRWFRNHPNGYAGV
jgi:UDP-glucose 4-epimerase